MALCITWPSSRGNWWCIMPETNNKVSYTLHLITKASRSRILEFARLTLCQFRAPTFSFRPFVPGWICCLCRMTEKSKAYMNNFLWCRYLWCMIWVYDKYMYDAYMHMMYLRCMRLSIFILLLYIWLVVDFVAAPTATCISLNSGPPCAHKLKFSTNSGCQWWEQATT